MLSSLINKIFKTKLALKIWLYMVIPTLAVLLSVYTLFITYSSKTIINDSIKKAQSETHYVASSFSNTYNSFLSRFVHKAASSDFKKKLNLITTHTELNHIEINNDLQPLFTDLVQINDLISSVLFEYLDDNKDILFYPYRYPLKVNVDDLKKSLNLEGDTYTPILIISPIKQLEVLPVAIALNYNKIDCTTLIAPSFKQSDFIIYFFFDLKKVNNFLDLYCNDNSQGTLYLVDMQGNNLSLPQSYSNYELLIDAEIQEQIQSMITNTLCYTTYKNNHIYIEPINNTNLHLVNIVPHELFTSEINTQQSYIMLIGIISILLITCLSILVSLFVTHPLNLLLEVVHHMKNNTYNKQLQLNTNDEISQLNESIHSMYKTIQQQIVTIKQEESEKYNTYLQMLTEQINPHFIYNALEFINIEVYTNHPENASKMISNLAKYLRITLSYGENELLISQEIEQVMAYINIINDRFNHEIRVITSIPEDLMNKKILKSTIQPLVENSLKHGFKIGINTIFPLTPFIEIKAVLELDYLMITVTDNGIGIDVEKATQIMLTKQALNEDHKHFGLNNIYERFKSHYGDVTITFSSIPFFENKVTIRIPSKFFINIK